MTARGAEGSSVELPDDDGPTGSDQVGASSTLIHELRQRIDAVDATLLRTLAERMSLVRQIGRHKQMASLSSFQLDRWLALIEHRVALGHQLGLREELIRALFERIHDEAVRIQEDLVHPTRERAPQP